MSEKSPVPAGSTRPTGTAAGSVLTGAIATAYSFPVSLTTLAALCLLQVLASLIPVPRRIAS